MLESPARSVAEPSTAVAHRPVRTDAGAAPARPRALRTSRMTRRETLVVSASILASVLLGALIGERHGFFDLSVYYGAVNYWTHTPGVSIYDFITPQSTYGFTYPPFAAIVMLPFALMEWHVAIVVTCVAIVAATLAVLFWFVAPLARRHGWNLWYAMGIAVAIAIAFDPLRETFLFGQVNMYLVAMVGFDLLVLTARNSRFSGVGIGLATAIKLTPGVFIVYLLVTKRWRAALTASAAAAGATLVGAAFTPDASRVFFTDALWNTDRVGQTAFISNQSLNGAVSRLNYLDPSTTLWIVSVVLVLAIWAVRVRRAVQAGDERTGFALTGVVTCLISPITWIHHLVWVMPALMLLVGHAFDASPKRRRMVWGITAFSFVVLASRLAWAYDNRWYHGFLLWFMSNAYVWICLLLLVTVPVPAAIRAGQRADQPRTLDLDRALANLLASQRLAGLVRRLGLSDQLERVQLSMLWRREPVAAVSFTEREIVRPPQ